MAILISLRKYIGYNILGFRVSHPISLSKLSIWSVSIRYSVGLFFLLCNCCYLFYYRSNDLILFNLIIKYYAINLSLKYCFLYTYYVNPFSLIKNQQSESDLDGNSFCPNTQLRIRNQKTAIRTCQGWEGEGSVAHWPHYVCASSARQGALVARSTTHTE